VYVDVDLSPVLQTVRHATEILSSNLAVIDCKVDELAGEQQASKSRLEELYTEFLAFVAKDTKEKQLQLAATEIVRVRQELEKRFGNYDIVRRTAIGILQAKNVAIVRQETMRTATEQLMLATPGYWLAPALIALTAWLHNDSALAERALREAIRRDDSRTSLFFTLVCRRADRMEASARWLSRYFEMQNPQSMEREVTVMLDALTNGVFGGSALSECSHVFDCWLKELENQAGFVNEQRKRWANRLIGIQATIGDNEYRTLRSQSATGQALMQSLKSARRNRLLHNHFTAFIHWRDCGSHAFRGFGG
jgi:hypothetical protein